ncbi:sensor histidine kinase [Salinarimonas soli]|uniref:sensor histidine kinase n=1 Tax=Salinarimonas soli TaxID=1638099 RepID=UPI001F0A3823|nr:ATP-binding protein [Salinarimonas soli]
MKLFRSTAFRLSLVYLVVFALSAFGTLGYVAWNAQRLLFQGLVGTVEAEITGLAEQYRVGGLRQLIAVVEARSREPGASLYLVTTPAGERVAGNVDALEPGVLDRPGQREITYQRGRREERFGEPHRAVVRVFVLPGGFRLLVGRDVEERARLRDVIRRAFGWSMLLVLGLGFFGGLFVTKRVLRRIDAMTDTTQFIMAGHLHGRLPLAGTGDELDRLAGNLNAMLDRIGVLMAGMRQVSDNIAHDLKTPLTRLRNRADEALRTARTPDELRAALEANIEESENLIRVFNALLMIARLEAGNAQDILSDIDAAEAARGVAELYDALAEEAGMSFEARIEGSLPVRGNRELLGQAIANLVDNAIKYGAPAPGEGEKPVVVSARRVGAEALITVADRGPGIPAAERDRVLERFVRLETARTRPGFGLGLSLVTAVAGLHGGRLILEDNGPGLRATLAIPLR